MNFGSKLKEIRLNKKMSQKELADILNVSQKTISNYENNERFPDEITIVKIANYFNVSTDWLFGISGEAKSLNEDFSFIFNQSANTLHNVKELTNSIIRKLKTGKKLSDLEEELKKLNELKSSFELNIQAIEYLKEKAGNSHPEVNENLNFTFKIAQLFLSEDTPEEVKKELESFYNYTSYKLDKITLDSNLDKNIDDDSEKQNTPE